MRMTKAIPFEKEYIFNVLLLNIDKIVDLVNVEKFS